MTAHLVAIHVAPAAGAPMRAVDAARAVPGRGLDGDRYAATAGTFSGKPDPGRDVTLIEVEALEGLAREYGLELAPAETRRNLLTRGVALNHLVGREFRVGEVRLQGIRLCEPCAHLEALAGKKVRAGLVHRGGLRAQVRVEGVLRVGDPIVLD